MTYLEDQQRANDIYMWNEALDAALAELPGDTVTQTSQWRSRIEGLKK